MLNLTMLMKQDCCACVLVLDFSILKWIVEHWRKQCKRCVQNIRDDDDDDRNELNNTGSFDGDLLINRRAFLVFIQTTTALRHTRKKGGMN